MCGRYTVIANASEAANRFEAQRQLIEFSTKRYNVAPSQQVPVVFNDSDGERCLDAFKWGLVPHWAKDEKTGFKMINLRAETLADKPTFKAALERRRCLVPASGFYEWQKVQRLGKETKQPIYITLLNEPLFAFAGLWASWKKPDGSWLHSCAIVTVAPNALMAEIHNRMPAILSREGEAAWLDPENHDAAALSQLLQPYPADEMTAHPVSTLVNAPANDQPACVEHMVEEEV